MPQIASNIVLVVSHLLLFGCHFKACVVCDPAEAIAGQFPYHVSLRLNETHICSGSIIGPQQILSAADCVTRNGRTLPLEFVSVLAGTIERNVVFGSDAVSTNVRNIIDDSNTALIETEKKLYEFPTANIAPVPFELESETTDNTKCIITGWNHPESGPLANPLVYTNVSILPLEHCAEIYQMRWAISAMIGDTNATVDVMPAMPPDLICVSEWIGDPGGPLVCDGKQIGIGSHGAADLDGKMTIVYKKLKRSGYLSGYSPVSKEENGSNNRSTIQNTVTTNRTSMDFISNITTLEAMAGQFPYQVSLLVDSRHVCSGSIIGPQWILSAADCVTQNDLILPVTVFRVVAGMNTQNDSATPDDSVLLNVRNISVNGMFYDYALIEMETALYETPTASIAPVQLELTNGTTTTDMPTTYAECILTHWNRTESDPLAGTIVYTKVEIIPIERCASTYQIRLEISTMLGTSNGTMPPEWICVREWNDADGTIFSDSGAPLVCDGKQVAIASNGAEGGNGKLPTVFTRLKSGGYLEQWNTNPITSGANITEALPPSTMEAHVGQFPYQVSLLVNENHVCSGSIIGPQKILSAADCVTYNGGTLPVTLFSVLAGTIQLNDIANPAAVHTKKVLSISVDRNKALIETEQPLYASPTPSIASVALLELSDAPAAYADCIISGWKRPKTERWTETLLHYTKVEIVPMERCGAASHHQLYWSVWATVPNPNRTGDFTTAITTRPEWLCAMEWNTNRTVVSESGAPLVCAGKQVGIGLPMNAQKYKSLEYVTTILGKPELSPPTNPPTITAKPTATTAVPTTSSDPIDVRILLGKRATECQFPYQVSLRLHGAHNCGGAIIGAHHVLTAAHCVTKNQRKMPARMFRVLVGTSDRENERLRDARVVKVRQIAIHNRFNQMRLHFDYAVVTTSEPMYEQPTACRRPIGLNTVTAMTPDEYGTCVISGWGEDEMGFKHKAMMFAEVEIWDDERCAKKTKFTQLPLDKICALGKDGEDAGRGDSGGPLVCNQKLVGLVSYGKPEVNKDYPGVFARVSSEKDWIMAVVNGGWSSSRFGGGSMQAVSLMVGVCGWLAQLPAIPAQI